MRVWSITFSRVEASFFTAEAQRTGRVAQRDILLRLFRYFRLFRTLKKKLCEPLRNLCASAVKKN
jgi:hypothetical protein